MLNSLKWIKIISDLLSNPEVQAAWTVLLAFLKTLSPDKQDAFLASLTTPGFCAVDGVEAPAEAAPAIEAIKAQAE